MQSFSPLSGINSTWWLIHSCKKNGMKHIFRCQEFFRKCTEMLAFWAGHQRGRPLPLPSGMDGQRRKAPIEEDREHHEQAGWDRAVECGSTGIGYCAGQSSASQEERGEGGRLAQRTGAWLYKSSCHGHPFRPRELPGWTEACAKLGRD